MKKTSSNFFPVILLKSLTSFSRCSWKKFGSSSRFFIPSITSERRIRLCPGVFLAQDDQMNEMFIKRRIIFTEIEDNDLWITQSWLYNTMDAKFPRLAIVVTCYVNHQ